MREPTEREPAAPVPDRYLANKKPAPRRETGFPCGVLRHRRPEQVLSTPTDGWRRSSDAGRHDLTVQFLAQDAPQPFVQIVALYGLP